MLEYKSLNRPYSRSEQWGVGSAKIFICRQLPATKNFLSRCYSLAMAVTSWSPRPMV